MAADQGLSIEEAQRRLALQERASGLILKLKQSLQDDYAGIWYERKSGDVRVGISPRADEATATKVVREVLGAAAGDEWALVPVRNSRAELESAQASIDQEWQARRSTGSIYTEIDDINNRVTVGVGSDATEADRAWVKQVRADFAAGQTVPAVASFPQLRGEQERLSGVERKVAVEIVVKQLDRSARGTTRAACKVSNHSCGAPLHGGVRITSSGATCSAGFTARWWSGSTWVPYTITAGHCMYLNPGSWSAIWAVDNVNYPIGPRHTWRFGSFGTSAPSTSNDIGLITMRTAAGSWGWDQLQTPRGRIVMWGWPSAGWDNWQISASAIAAPNEYGCRSGRTSTFTCGLVASTSRTLEVYLSGTSGPTTFVGNNFTVPGACSQPGDSGGPFVDGGIGLGVLSSGIDSPCETNYQHVWDAAYHFGVELYL